MKRKTTYLKSLLVSSLLILGGVNSWAQTTAFSQDFTAVGESTDPSDYGFTLSYGAGSSSDLVKFSVENGVLKCDAGPYASGSAGARTGTATATFDAIGTGNEITLSYTWALGSATGNASGSYTKTRIGNGSGNALELAFYGSESNGTLKVNGTTVKSGNSSIRNTTYTVTATLNMNAQKITALTLTCSNNSFSYTATDNIDFASAITTIDRFAFENSERQNWANTSSVDNVNITYTEAKEVVESIAVNYTFGDETIYTDNISFSGLYCGDTYTVPFRMYIEKDGALYKTTANGSNPHFGNIVTLTKNTIVTKALTAVDLNGGTLALLADLDDSEGENAGIRASYCSGYNNKAYTSTETLEPGIYTFIVRALNKGRGSSIKVGNTTVCGIDQIVAKNSWGDNTFTGVEIPKAGNVTLVKGGSNTIDCYDIIIAIKTNNIYENVVVSAAGYATYVSENNLDFSNATTKAYKVKVANKGVATLTEVEKVPANTPVLLYAEKGNGAGEAIPVVATADAVEDNDLVAGAGANVATTDGDYTNMILNNVNNKVGFYFANNQMVAANRAYLHILTTLAPDASNARMQIVFDSETSGIKSVNNALNESGNYFNLSGQRISEPAKGLYIVNGKKVIIK